MGLFYIAEGDILYLCDMNTIHSRDWHQL